jgi:hypothetical protein
MLGAGIVFTVGPLVGLVAGGLGLQWAFRSHRKERRPWLEMLEVPAATAANAGNIGALDGLVSDGHGAITPLVAPFSGRVCVAYSIDIVAREMSGNQTTWERVFSGGAGRFFLVGPDGQPHADVDFQGGRLFSPEPVDEYNKLSAPRPETVFQGPPEQVPPHLVEFVRHLAPALQARIARPGTQMFGGKRLFFNERMILPGQSVVAAGFCEPGDVGIRVAPAGDLPVSFAFGTVADQRAKLLKAPLGELFGALIAAVLVGGVATVILANVFG